MAALVINNKVPETVINALHKKWIQENPGIPSKGSFADNGGELKTQSLKKLQLNMVSRLH